MPACRALGAQGVAKATRAAHARGARAPAGKGGGAATAKLLSGMFGGGGGGGRRGAGRAPGGAGARVDADVDAKLAALAKRVWEKKALWLVHMAPEQIAKTHIADLSNKYQVQGLDLSELRAVYAALPNEFENDRNGAKAQWRAAARAKLEAMVKRDGAGQLSALEKRHWASPSSTPTPLRPPPPRRSRAAVDGRHGGGGAAAAAAAAPARARARGRERAARGDREALGRRRRGAAVAAAATAGARRAAARRPRACSRRSAQARRRRQRAQKPGGSPARRAARRPAGEDGTESAARARARRGTAWAAAPRTRPRRGNGSSHRCARYRAVVGA